MYGLKELDNQNKCAHTVSFFCSASVTDATHGTTGGGTEQYCSSIMKRNGPDPRLLEGQSRDSSTKRSSVGTIRGRLGVTAEE